MSFGQWIWSYTGFMAEIPDLQLHHQTGSDDGGGIRTDLLVDDRIEGDDRSKWIILIALSVLAAGILTYVVIQRQRARTPQAVVAPVSAPAVAPLPKAKEGPLVQAENIPLPPLAETDALVRQLLVKLSSHPKVLAWLATGGLIENFTVATLNISEGKSPTMHWRALAPQARFSILNTNRGTMLDPRSYRRYDDYAAAIGALSAPGTARLYLTLKPRITEAYRDLGYPEGDFDLVLERAMHELVTAPALPADVPLSEKVITYKFADTNLESSSAAQKQLLRMGPDNMRTVQAKLRDIATQLALHP
jgi:hypothetical protein